MAGDWIKVEHVTPDKPEVLRIARILDKNRVHIFGALVRFWIWLDATCADGQLCRRLVDADVDAIVDMPGFAAALIEVGWLLNDKKDERFIVPNFDYHLSQNAKSRALKTRRQKKWRAKNAPKSVDASTSTRRLPEKRREEKIIDDVDITPDLWKSFDLFWNSYPRKVKKQNAAQVWSELQPSADLLARILKAIESQKLSHQWRVEQKIPNPDGWLSGQRWEDELPKGGQDDRGGDSQSKRGIAAQTSRAPSGTEEQRAERHRQLDAITKAVPSA